MFLVSCAGVNIYVLARRLGDGAISTAKGAGSTLAGHATEEGRQRHVIPTKLLLRSTCTYKERFPSVSIPLEVQALVLYCISAMMCEDD